MEQTYAFGIGDKVRIFRMDVHEPYYAYSNRTLLGETGTILDINTDKKYAYIRFNTTESFCEAAIPLKDLEIVEKAKPKYYNGKVVCTRFMRSYDHPSVAFTPGKVYKIENGVLYDDKPPCPYLNNITSLDYIRKSNYVDVDFIEFKGEA